tara:strand:- start:2139 stop:4352 length:2214 start_codon:yes stop_codon:yes gene_type:complete
MEYEDSYVLNDSGLTQAQFANVGVSTHIWENINEKATVSFDIVQIGTSLYFYDALKTAASATPKNGGVAIVLPGDGNIRWQSAILGGRIVFVTGNATVLSLQYDEATDTVTFDSHGLLSRDVWGIDDGLDNDERPNSLTPQHEYNLINQGWGKDNPDSALDYYQKFKADIGEFPSNADLVQAGKNIGNDSIFSSFFSARAYTGNTPAPKGHSIIDVFDRSSSRGYAPNNTGLLNNMGFSSGLWAGGIYGSIQDLLLDVGFVPNGALPGIPVDKTLTGVTAVATYAERFFYAGMESALTGGDSKSPLLGHLVFFSQLVDANDKLGKCYQDGDPTSEDDPDVVATDGGFIKIPEMSRCLRLVPFARSLVVFAENGVWEITGSDSGFKATDFQVVKITDTGALNAGSIVEVEDLIYFWSRGGIYRLTRNDVSTGIGVESISETTIQTIFEGFNTSATTNVTGVYDTVAKQIRWMLNALPAYSGTEERAQYETEIVFDVLLEAFYLTKLPAPDGDLPYMAGYTTTPGFLTAEVRNDVIIGGDDVVSAGNDVVTNDDVRQGDFSQIKYLAILPSTLGATYKYTYSSFRGLAFEDWPTAQGGSGTDAAAFMLSGYETLGDSQRQKQVTYITTHFLRTESGFTDTGDGNLEAINPSSCLIQSQWDFSNSASSGKFGTPFQAYRLKRNYIPSGTGDTFDYGQRVITTKNKLRGRGRALSLLFSTEPGHDLILLGWGNIYGVNKNV